MRAGISARSTAAIPDFGNGPRVQRPVPPQVDNQRYEQDPTQWVKVDPKLVWKIETYAEPQDGHCQMEAPDSVVLKGSSTSQWRSIVCEINHQFILADILALGISVLPEPGAHARKIAEQMVMALQAHHSELDQKLADAWKRQAVRDGRTGF